MDANVIGTVPIYDPCRMCGEGDLPNEYLVNWQQMSWLLAGTSYNKLAIMDIHVECDWPMTVDRAYIKTQFHLPHMLRRRERFERAPKAAHPTEKDEHRQADLDGWRRWLEEEELVELPAQHWFMGVKEEDDELCHPG